MLGECEECGTHVADGCNCQTSKIDQMRKTITNYFIDKQATTAEVLCLSEHFMIGGCIASGWSKEKLFSMLTAHWGDYEDFYKREADTESKG
jgi:hypothetical protein